MSDNKHSESEFYYLEELEFQEEKEVCSTHDLDRLVAIGLLEKRC